MHVNSHMRDASLLDTSLSRSASSRGGKWISFVYTPTRTHFYLRVHDKRTMLHNRLADGPSGHEEEAQACLVVGARRDVVPRPKHQCLRSNDRDRVLGV